jgi:hypothetical protein
MDDKPVFNRAVSIYISYKRLNVIDLFYYSLLVIVIYMIIYYVHWGSVNDKYDKYEKMI